MIIGWPVAFLVVGVVGILSALGLFLVVYLKELKREDKILKGYKDEIKGMSLPLVFLDLPPQGRAPQHPATKKTIN